MEVGDQKFISRNSEGFALKDCLTGFVFASSTSNCEAARSIILSLGSSSSITSTDRDIVSRFPNKFERIQLPWYLSVSVNALVKYLCVRRFRLLGELFGETKGEAGRDLLPLLARGSHPLGAPSIFSWGMSEESFLWTFEETIWWATRITEVPHFAASPLKPSSVPFDLILVCGGSFSSFSVTCAENDKCEL